MTLTSADQAARNDGVSALSRDDLSGAEVPKVPLGDPEFDEPPPSLWKELRRPQRLPDPVGQRVRGEAKAFVQAVPRVALNVDVGAGDIAVEAWGLPIAKSVP
jgi:hypothetical protein